MFYNINPRSRLTNLSSHFLSFTHTGNPLAFLTSIMSSFAQGRELFPILFVKEANDVVEQDLILLP
jgi:hypothetical protein